MADLPRTLVFALVGAAAFTVYVPARAAEEWNDQRLRDEVLKFSREGGSLPQDKREALLACGERATKAILEVLKTPQVRGGRRAAGTPPSSYTSAVYYRGDLFRLIREIEAPIPVDELCDLIELGMKDFYGTRSQGVVSLLAQSGTAKARVYIERFRQLAAASASEDDARREKAMEGALATWELCRDYIRTGTVPEAEVSVFSSDGREFKRHVETTPAMIGMRRAYQEDPGVLKATVQMDTPYLERRFRETFPLLRDASRSILSGYPEYGRFYESQLTPLITRWLKGERGDIEKAFGGELCHRRQRGGRGAAMRLVRDLVSRMTGDEALAIKLELLSRGSEPDIAYCLGHHDTARWLPQLIAAPTNSSNRRNRAEVVIRTLAALDRPLSQDERTALRERLTVPLLRFGGLDPPRDGDDGWRVVDLARKEPDLFREALRAEHLSAPVVHAAIETELFDEPAEALPKIRYAMLNDYGNLQRRPVSPEELAKKLARLPAHVRARMKAAQARGVRRRINTGPWCKLLRRHFIDSDAGEKFLAGLLADPEFADGKREFEGELRAFKQWRERERSEPEKVRAPVPKPSPTPARASTSKGPQPRNTPKEARTGAAAATAATPANADRLFRLAKACQTEGREEEAQQHWQRFLRAEPSGPRADAVRNGWIVLSSHKMRVSKPSYPVWAPDGTRILCGYTNPCIVDPRDGTVTQPSNPGGDDLLDHDWSPDGGTFACFRNKGDQRVISIYERRAAGLVSTDSAPGVQGIVPRFSPDGKRLLVSNMGGRHRGRMGIVHLGTGELELVPWRHSQRSGIDQGAWAPDGDTVVCHAYSWPAKPDDKALFTIRLGTGSATQLTKGDGMNLHPVVRPDGRSVAYTVRTGPRNAVTLVGLDGAVGPVELVPGATPGWSPDGRRLACAVHGANPGLVVVDLGGLDSSPVRMRAKLDGDRLLLGISNREARPVSVNVRYELFDSDSYRIALGSVGDSAIGLGPGGSAEETLGPGEWDAADARIAKLTAVTPEGARAVRLVDLRAR